MTNTLMWFFPNKNFFIALYKIMVDNVNTKSKFIKTLCFSYSVVDFFNAFNDCGFMNDNAI